METHIQMCYKIAGLRIKLFDKREAAKMGTDMEFDILKLNSHAVAIRMSLGDSFKIVYNKKAPHSYVAQKEIKIKELRKENLQRIIDKLEQEILVLS